MIQLREQYFAYPMPDAEGAEIRGEHPGRQYQLLSFYGEADAVPLPPGTWEIVCTSKEVTKKHAKLIVEMTHPGGFGRSAEEYKNYTNSGICFCPVYSFETLLTSKWCDLNKTYLILKKQ
jgi:hypothetical protein